MDPQGAPQHDPLIGQTVGNYLVTQKLGEGGMGSVYLAEHPTIQKKVAIKVLHSEFSTNQDVANRFLTEAKAVTAIDHPNIVQIIDYGVLTAGQRGDQMVYITMEFLQGITLSQLIRTEAPLPPERALTIAMQVADALASSHRIGIVHRDLKPDNIILVTRGRERDFVKVLDFGIAKLTGEGGLSSHRTRTGLVLGTPAYMSPEQCEGKPNVDHRTDIYALGIVVYEMLVGRTPFVGEGYGDILVQHLTQRPVEPSRYRMMSPHVEQVVLKALEKRADLRYPTMEEFMRAMGDPVGYVEANGGIGGFLQRQLMPSSAPLPNVRMTPAPMIAPTPTPYGLMSPAPGSLTPVPGQVPTTLGSAAGQVAGGKSSKLGFVIGGAIVAVSAAVGITVVLLGAHKGSNGGGTASGSAGSAGSAVVASVTDGTGSARPLAAGGGSATASTGSAAAGSATAGSAAAGSATPAAGSGAKVATGSGATAPKPDVTIMKLTVTSDPPGAEIFVDGADLQKKTNTTLLLPISHAKAQIRLKLHGYDDYVFQDIPLDGGDLAETASLKKERVVVPSSGHTGHTGHGNGSAASHPTNPTNDTGLMRPDDL